MENIRYAIGIYKKKDGDCDELVGYAPAGVLSLLYHFLQTSDDNCVEVEILGKRKLEVGLVVPLRYNACAMAKLQRWTWQTTKIIDSELSKCKKSYVFLDLLRKGKRSYCPFPIYQQIHGHIFSLAFILYKFFV